jgi:hypothetical protein
VAHLLPGDLLRGCGLRTGCLPLHALRLQLGCPHRHARGEVLHSEQLRSHQRAAPLFKRVCCLLGSPGPLFDEPLLLRCDPGCRCQMLALMPKLMCPRRHRLSLLQNHAPSRRLPPLHCQHASSQAKGSSRVQEEVSNFVPTAPTEQARCPQCTTATGHLCTGWSRSTVVRNHSVAHILACYDASCTARAEAHSVCQSMHLCWQRPLCSRHSRHAGCAVAGLQCTYQCRIRLATTSSSVCHAQARSLRNAPGRTCWQSLRSI